MDHAALADALCDIVAQALAEAPRFDPPPNIDLAVAAFPPGRPPVFANVLFSRDWPRGLVASLPDDAGAVRNLAYFADPTDAQRTSIAWAPGADWTILNGLRQLAGPGPHQFIAPYPASLIKLMVAVGTGLLVDRGRAAWDEPWAHGSETRPVAAWADPMLTLSDNTATRALVALLHARGLIERSGPPDRDGAVPERNRLHAAFARVGLDTLRLANTRPDGGWLNSDGAGVGWLQMTAWDSLRLLWLLRPELPAPWLAPDSGPLLQPATAARLWGWLDEQALHEVLSSVLRAGQPGWMPGIPARLPARWLGPDGRARIDGLEPGADLRPAQAAAQVHFAHKTGTTASYASDAGWVESLAPGGRRYLVALLSTLGSRHAPGPALAVPPCLARIGAGVDGWLAQRLG
ncbi:hypothetical protein ISF6_4951 [Piscinibacter sakaiensis]|uniref:Beta-lactamase n=1 Tax=Piscinibacter sakaiensis TaxID=1547922 RepID=A0A0K8P756_PISS1|nr:hypothetical protein ISF6_4951 [Piscinibacter sakaiensis]